MRSRTLKIAAVMVAGAVVLAAGAGSRAYYLLKAPVALEAPVDFEVDRGEAPHSVAARLAERGLVRSAPLVLLLARASGLDREIRFGTHRFEGSLTPAQVLQELARTPQPTIRVTIAEGSTWAEIGAQLEAAGIVSAADYREAVCDSAVVTSLGTSKTANCAEGFLFPDTYNLAPGMTASEIAALQLRRFDEVIRELLARLPADTSNAIVPARGEHGDDWQSDASMRSQVITDAVVLASIIEKEARLAGERGLISSVFHNRLRQGVRLQADPTVIYGIVNTSAARTGGAWDPALLPRYVREPSPYNTYTVDGLPAGPICNPGRDAIWAALRPSDTKYLYFVARGDGSHEFTSTLVAHNRAVARLRAVRERPERLTFAGPSPSIPAEQAAEAGPDDDTDEAPERDF